MGPDEICSDCGNPNCRHGPDGWCPAHGWDCRDYHQHLREQLAALAGG